MSTNPILSVPSSTGQPTLEWRLDKEEGYLPTIRVGTGAIYFYTRKSWKEFLIDCVSSGFDVEPNKVDDEIPF